MHPFDVFSHGAVNRLAVAHIGDVDHHFDQMLHRPTGLFDQLPDVLHHLMGLLDRIMAVDVHSIIEILRALSPQINGLAALRDHRLTQIIVQMLFWIGVFGVEFANACMGHVDVLLSYGAALDRMTAAIPS